MNFDYNKVADALRLYNHLVNPDNPMANPKHSEFTRHILLICRLPDGSAIYYEDYYDPESYVDPRSLHQIKRDLFADLCQELFA